MGVVRIWKRKMVAGKEQKVRNIEEEGRGEMMKEEVVGKRN